MVFGTCCQRIVLASDSTLVCSCRGWFPPFAAPWQQPWTQPEPETGPHISFTKEGMPERVSTWHGCWEVCASRTPEQLFGRAHQTILEVLMRDG